MSVLKRRETVFGCSPNSSAILRKDICVRSSLALRAAFMSMSARASAVHLDSVLLDVTMPSSRSVGVTFEEL